MRRLRSLSLCLLISCGIAAQNTFTCIILDSAGTTALADISVVIKGTGKGSFSDSAGKIVLKNIPNGLHTVVFSSPGFKEQSTEINFPLSRADSVFTIRLLSAPIDLETVFISSTRTDSRIENTPTRVEVLGSEEVEEESGVKPSHIASLLGDVAGIQSQQTSAVSGNTDLRIQGLPGDYTQLLRDGLPLFGGYAGSFSVLQIPPLDLKQIEIIKGASSTLYGGGAIAGMINIISKKPKLGVEERYLLLNQSSLKESNVNVFLSERDKKRGYTFFAGGTYQKQVDKNRDGFSDLPLIESIHLHPSFFAYPNEKNTISVGLNSTFEERKGGDMYVLRNRIDSNHQFHIENRSYRNTLDITWDRKINRNDKFNFKGTGTWYYRNITTSSFGLKAKQIAYLTEGSYIKKSHKHDLVAGINLSGEYFKKRLPDSSLIANYSYFTLGLYVQDDWRIHPKFIMEGGLRTDFHNRFGSFILPRVSLLYKISPVLTTRLGGGLGYKIPTLFNSEVDERDYQFIRFDPNSNIKAERSGGVNWDINFKKKIGETDLTINQSFYITRIDDPLVAFIQPGGIFYRNESKPILTRGFETWIQVAYEGLEAYIGYTLTDARKKYDPVHPWLSLSARNKIASIVSYEFSKRIRACIEASYIGKQYLDDGTQTPSFPIVAGMVRYDIGRLSFVLNGENLLDYRQTKKESIVIPPGTNPSFKQLWAPIDGRAVNLSMRIKL